MLRYYYLVLSPSVGVCSLLSSFRGATTVTQRNVFTGYFFRKTETKQTIIGKKNIPATIFSECLHISPSSSIPWDPGSIEHLSSESYSNFLSGLVQKGSLMSAVGIFFYFHKKGKIPNSETLLSMINALLQQRRLHKARTLMDVLETENMPKGGIDVYNKLISALLKEGYFKDALKLSDEMNNKGLIMSTSNFNRLVQSCGNRGECALNKGIELIIQMQKNKLKISTNSVKSMSQGLSLYGRLHEFLDLLAQGNT